VVEHPTTDFQPITAETLTSIARDVEQLLAAGRTIVLVDSGGQTRTGTVCKTLGLIEDPRT
jgi:glutamate 5-kinase